MVEFKVRYDVESPNVDVFQQVQESLKELPKKIVMHATMLVEDFVEEFAKEDPKGFIMIQVETRFGETYIKLYHKGKKFNPLEQYEESLIEEESYDDEFSSLNHIKKVLFKSFEQGITYYRRGNANIISLKVHTGTAKSLYLNLGALVLAIVVGQLLKMYVPETVGAFLNTTVLVPIKTIFMNSLNLIVVPVVFFSIANCISGFTNLSELGRIGGKSFGLYLFTSVMAVLIAVFVYYIATPSVVGVDLSSVAMVETASVKISLIDTLVGIFPSNIIAPFANADMLQLIFLGLLVGVGAASLGEKGKAISTLLDSFNELFIKIMGFVIKFMPYATFATVTSVVWSMGLGIVISLMGVIGCFLLGVLLIMIVYALLIIFVAKKNPFPLFRKVVPVLVTAFSLASSNATLPTTMDTCQHKLGIDSKVSSFTLAMGATINMDGICIYTMVTTLFLANAYGLEVTTPVLISLCGIVLLISIGMPGMPGSGLIAISMAAAQIGLPAEAIALVVGVDRLGGMLRTASNVLGDIAVTTVVAKSENMLNDEIYDS